MKKKMAAPSYLFQTFQIKFENNKSIKKYDDGLKKYR